MPSVSRKSKLDSLGPTEMSQGMIDSMIEPIREAFMSAGMKSAIDLGHSAETKPAVRSIDDLISRAWLAFKDEKSELEYQAKIQRSLCKSVLPACVGVSVFSAYSLYGSLFGGKGILIADWSTPAHRGYNLGWLFIFFLTLCLGLQIKFNPMFPRYRKTEHTIAAIFSAIIWLRCFLGNRWRCARLFGEDPENVFGAYSVDSELLMNGSAAVVYLCMCTDMRFKMSLWPGCSIVLSYVLSTSATGAPGASNSAAVNTMTLAGVCAFIFVGQRKIELNARRHFILQIEDENKILAIQKEKESMEEENRKLAEQETFRLQQASAFDEIFAMEEPGPASVKRNAPQKVAAPAATPKGAEVKPSGSGSLLSLNPADLPPPGESLENVKSPNRFLGMISRQWVVSMEAMESAAERMRDRSYSVLDFYADCEKAFPELTLYTFNPDDPDQGSRSSTAAPQINTSSSGRTLDDEMQRTWGALYSVYWLVRQDMDGKYGFCFGFDDSSGELNKPPAEGVDPDHIADLKKKVFFAMTNEERRLNFFHHFPWSKFQELLVGAGLISGSETTGFEVCRERMKACLVLTAIHDVFKNEALLPTVQPEHSPYNGYEEGQVIHDHDVALEYVLTHFAHLLPSYACLGPNEQKAVRFTQGKMGFNNGWLVQGEAPPGALFKTFKDLISTDNVPAKDVSFYFVHWLTDLAGAEPTPKLGSEKFVLKFPDFVLASFLRSFPYVWELATKTETRVLQEYLQAAWFDRDEPLGKLPTGESSIALMRLVLQAQKYAGKVTAAWAQLQKSDRELLGCEMARTGMHQQLFDEVSPPEGEGPAILVYYAPALLQKSGSTDLTSALEILAEVYRKARFLWPVKGRPSIVEVGKEEEDSGKGLHTVIVRIDQIKDLLPADMRAVGPMSGAGANAKRRGLIDVEGWFLVKKNDKEAVVEKHYLKAINSFNETGTAYTWLNL